MQSSNFQKAFFTFLVLLFLTSCSSVGLLTRSIQENKQSNSYLNDNFEPLKRTDYSLLSATTGYAQTRQFYILFFPIGKSKTNQELESNAYNQAVENCPSADAVILPRTKYKRFFIPLLLVNYSSRSIAVKGRGVKLIENKIKITYD